MQFPKELQPPDDDFGIMISHSLNEVQFPKELQLSGPGSRLAHNSASMKCSSRRNCNLILGAASIVSLASLNEVQFPKELQPGSRCPTRRARRRLNEVQFPKELQPRWPTLACCLWCLNEVQFPKELQLWAYHVSIVVAWPQ